MSTVVQKIYVGQTALTLEFDTSIDLSTATGAVIKYIKSDKTTTGEWAGVISSPASDGLITYDIASASDLNVSGSWKMWVYVTFSGGTVAPGSVANVKVYEQGT